MCDCGSSLPLDSSMSGTLKGGTFAPEAHWFLAERAHFSGVSMTTTIARPFMAVIRG